MLKAKNLSTVKLIQILYQRSIILIDIIEQELESIIDNAHQEMDSEDSVAIISQIIIDGVCYSRHYLLSNYLLENGHFYYHSKLYLPNINLLYLWVLQESKDQSVAKHSKITKICEIL